MEKLHSLKRMMNPEGQSTGNQDCLSPSQWLVLQLVGRQEGIGIKELAAQLDISSSAATQIVDGLVSKGFLDKQPSPEDRRALNLSLPEIARRRLDAAKEQRLERINSVFETLDDAEFQTFLDLLNKVIARTQNKKEVV